MSDEEDDRKAVRSMLDFAMENRCTLDDLTEAIVSMLQSARYEAAWRAEHKDSPFVRRTTSPSSGNE